ncbi:MAG: FAD-binding oxidoreductase [Vicinamibacterales bacterium]
MSGPPLPARFCTNFGGYGRGVPDAVVEATCEEDVCAVLRVSRQLGIPVAVRGTGHSSNGRLAIADGGILLVNATPADPDVIVSPGLADIEARAQWRAVESRLNHAAASVRVLTDTLTLSVGGTISVGGYGVRSIRWGAQVDHVESLRIILPDGTPVECSADHNPELFRFALGGIGAVGVIERVRIRTQSMPAFSRAYVGTSRTWRQALEALREIASMPQGDTLDDAPAELSATFFTDGRCLLRRRYYFATREEAEVAVSPGLPVIANAKAEPVDRASWFSEADDVDRWLAQFSGTRKVWADYLLDYLQFCEFMTEIERRARSGHEGHRYLPSVYVLAIRIPSPASAAKGFVAASALSPSAGATGAYRFGCGLYHMVPENDAAGVAATIAACEDLVNRCIELGGRPYLHGVASMSEFTRRQVYGDDYERLLQLRRQHDPDGLFNGGWFRRG